MPVFHRHLKHSYPRVVRGEGCWLFDDQDNAYLDGSGGALVANLGHGLHEIAHAIGRQAGTVAYASGAIFSNEPVAELAAELDEVLPEPLAYSYFLCSGSEAIEASVKLARQYWRERGRGDKWKVVSRVPSYHGNTLTALSLSGREHYRAIYGPLLTDFPRVPAPDRYRRPHGDTWDGTAVIREIERQGPETVAAFLAEPVIGSSLGAMAPEPEYYQRIAEACRELGVLFIADEVMAGIGRTGRWFSFEHFGVVPDVVVCGKGLSGGYAPLSAVIASREIVETIRDGSGAFVHAQTYSHMPLTAAAGVATLRYIKANGLVEHVASMEELFFGKLDALRAHRAVGDVRGRGFLAGVELVADRESKRPYPRSEKVAERVAAAALANGLVVWSNAGHLEDGDGDILMIGPSFTISTDEIDEIVARLKRALEQTLGR
jgi:adenosylmethionine-8-amino-7-oxononanoate aminotransferase